MQSVSSGTFCSSFNLLGDPFQEGLKDGFDSHSDGAFKCRLGTVYLPSKNQVNALMSSVDDVNSIYEKGANIKDRISRHVSLPNIFSFESKPDKQEVIDKIVAPISRGDQVDVFLKAKVKQESSSKDKIDFVNKVYNVLVKEIKDPRAFHQAAFMEGLIWDKSNSGNGEAYPRRSETDPVMEQLSALLGDTRIGSVKIEHQHCETSEEAALRGKMSQKMNITKPGCDSQSTEFLEAFKSGCYASALLIARDHAIDANVLLEAYRGMCDMNVDIFFEVLCGCKSSTFSEFIGKCDSLMRDKLLIKVCQCKRLSLAEKLCDLGVNIKSNSILDKADKMKLLKKMNQAEREAIRCEVDDDSYLPGTNEYVISKKLWPSEGAKLGKRGAGGVIGSGYVDPKKAK